MTSEPKRPSTDRTLPLRSRRKRRERFSLLASWYGEERAEVEISSHTHQPALIGGLLDEVLSSTKNKDGGTLVKLSSSWKEIMGAEFSRFTEPVALKDGVLTMSVRHSAFLVELKPSLDIFVAAINRVAGENVCREIRLTTGK